MSILPKIEPMKLSLRSEPFDNPDYIFELKHDGFRALAYISDGKCQLVSRRRNSYKRFGSLSEAMAGLKVKSAILDGEIVCLDSEGRSVFYDPSLLCLRLALAQRQRPAAASLDREKENASEPSEAS